MSELVATYEDQTDDLEQLLSEIDGGYKVTIARKEPPWAAGQLGTTEFDKTDTISIDWIRSRYGGGLFTLKIKYPDGKYITHRTVVINERPKNRNGIEIYPGTDGVPITKDELPNANPPPPQQDNTMLLAMKEIMAAQAQQAKATQEMLAQRVASLETLFMQSMTNAQTQPQPNPHPQSNYDPNAQLKSTLETFKMIEELKENVKSEETDDFDSPLLSKAIDKIIDKFTDNTQPQQQQQQGTQPLPPRTEPNNMELARMAKERMAAMDEDERQYLINYLMEEEEEDDPEYEEQATSGEQNPIEVTEEIDPSPGQQDNEQVNSLLSGGDKAMLNDSSQPADGSTEI